MTVAGAAVALPGAVGAGVSTTEGNEQLQQLIADVAKLAETVAVLAARPAPAPPPPQIIMQPAPAVRKRHFLSHLYIKCIILPRQARDEHRENSKKVPFSLRGGRRTTYYLPVRSSERDGQQIGVWMK